MCRAFHQFKQAGPDTVPQVVNYLSEELALLELELLLVLCEVAAIRAELVWWGPWRLREDKNVIQINYKNCHLTETRTTSIAFWKVGRALTSPNGMLVNLYRP